MIIGHLFATIFLLALNVFPLAGLWFLRSDIDWKNDWNEPAPWALTIVAIGAVGFLLCVSGPAFLDVVFGTEIFNYIWGETDA